jgi:drug/metabolite transporter (DMT)-like permease
MFIGELIPLIIYFIWFRKEDKIAEGIVESYRKENGLPYERINLIKLLIPAICDYMLTFLSYIGLLLVNASIF